MLGRFPKANKPMGKALVAVQLPFDASFTTTLDAVWEAGDAGPAGHPDLPEAEVEALLAALRPGFLVDASGIRPLPDAEPVEPGTALVVPTSGTTTRPKGVVLTHDNLSASALATATRLELGEEDRWLCCVPPSHIAGLMVLVRARLTGHEAVLHPRFDPAAIAGEDSTNVVSLVPTMLRRLLQVGSISRGSAGSCSAGVRSRNPWWQRPPRRAPGWSPPTA